MCKIFKQDANYFILQINLNIVVRSTSRRETIANCNNKFTNGFCVKRKAQARHLTINKGSDFAPNRRGNFLLKPGRKVNARSAPGAFREAPAARRGFHL